MRRTVKEMQDRAEFILARAKIRDSGNLPTPVEIGLAEDNLALCDLFSKADKLIASGFIDEWRSLRKEAGIR